MKKRLTIISVLLAALLFSGCSSAPKAEIYDDSVPFEQSSTIKIWECNVIEFNEISVKGWGNHSATRLIGTGIFYPVVIPAGTHTFKLWREIALGDSLYTWRITTTPYQFLPGHTYLVTTIGGNSTNPPHSIILDETEFNREPIPDPKSPNASPFEGKWVNTKDKESYLIFFNNELFYSERISNYNYIARGEFSYKGQIISFPGNATRRGDGNWYYSIPLDLQFEFNGTTLSGKTVRHGVQEFKKVE